MKPIIGITASYFFENDTYACKSSYINALQNCNAQVILLPTNCDVKLAKKFINIIDGLLIPGGCDVSPLLYEEEPTIHMGRSNIQEDLFEIEMIKLAHDSKKPILGICRGLQVINVAFGGNLYQDIENQFSNKINHKQHINMRSESTHTVLLKKDSAIADITKSIYIHTNSYHHQGINRLANNLTATGYSKDGVIEVIEDNLGLILAVQFHPEHMTDNAHINNIFKHFINCCNKKTSSN